MPICLRNLAGPLGPWLLAHKMDWCRPHLRKLLTCPVGVLIYHPCLQVALLRSIPDGPLIPSKMGGEAEASVFWRPLVSQYSGASLGPGTRSISKCLDLLCKCEWLALTGGQVFASFPELLHCGDSLNFGSYLPFHKKLGNMLFSRHWAN